MEPFTDMWHSQILGSFEAKNITSVFLHENSFLVIEIIKDIFPDDKKCKKVQKNGLKCFFFAAIFKIEFSSPMTEHRFLVFSLNSAILSAAQHETLSFLREHVFLWNADNILHLSVLFLLNFSGQIPLITGVQTFCKIFGYIQAAFWQLYGWLQGLSSQIPFRCTLCPG